MLRRTPSLTEQAKSLIKQRIIDAEFDDGRIPSETDLANELGVSRTTIRDALSRLELEGTIFRKQGAGTFVNQASLQIQTRLEEIWAYELMLEAHGYVPSTQLISVEEQPVDDQTAADLNLAPTDTILLVKKLFLADNQPVIFTLNYIPTRFIANAYSKDTFRQPIFQFLADACQQQLAYYLSEIVPLISPDWLVDILNLRQQQSTALIAFEEIGYNQNNVPLLKAQSFFRDDLLRLRLIRREA
jgi:GntR family transcriptional regulator